MSHPPLIFEAMDDNDDGQFTVVCQANLRHPSRVEFRVPVGEPRPVCPVCGRQVAR